MLSNDSTEFLSYINENLLIPVWKDRNLSVVDKFCTPNIDVHTTFLHGTGIQAVHDSFAMLFKAFQVFNLKIEELLEYNKRITYKWSAYAEQTEPILHFPIATQPLYFNGIVFLEFNDQGLATKYHSFSNIPQVLQTALFGEKSGDYNKTIENVAVEWSELLFIVAKYTHKNLTYREIECLYYWVYGYSIKETARKLGGLSGKTVQVYRDNIRKKFNNINYHELISLLHQTCFLLQFLDKKIR